MLFEITTAVALALVANTTEVQVNICDSAASVESRLNLTDKSSSSWNQKKPQTSYFIENSHYELYKKNWVFKIQFHDHDDNVEVVIKNNAPSEQPQEPEAQDRTELKCENDLHGSHKKTACKMTATLSWEEFDAATSRHDYASLLSSSQRRWLQHENMQLPNDLEMTGAFNDQNYKKNLNQFQMTLTISKGSTPSARPNEFIEISIRTDSQNELDVQKQLLAYLKRQNIQICADQGPLMTRLKLESFFKTRSTSP